MLAPDIRRSLWFFGAIGVCVGAVSCDILDDSTALLQLNALLKPRRASIRDPYGQAEVADSLWPGQQADSYDSAIGNGWQSYEPGGGIMSDPAAAALPEGYGGGGIGGYGANLAAAGDDPRQKLADSLGLGKNKVSSAIDNIFSSSASAPSDFAGLSGLNAAASFPAASPTLPHSLDQDQLGVLAGLTDSSSQMYNAALPTGSADQEDSMYRPFHSIAKMAKQAASNPVARAPLVGRASPHNLDDLLRRAIAEKDDLARILQTLGGAGGMYLDSSGSSAMASPALAKAASDSVLANSLPKSVAEETGAGAAGYTDDAVLRAISDVRQASIDAAEAHAPLALAVEDPVSSSSSPSTKAPASADRSADLDALLSSLASAGKVQKSQIDSQKLSPSLLPNSLGPPGDEAKVPVTPAEKESQRLDELVRSLLSADAAPEWKPPATDYQKLQRLLTPNSGAALDEGLKTEPIAPAGKESQSFDELVRSLTSDRAVLERKSRHDATIASESPASQELSQALSHQKVLSTDAAHTGGEADRLDKLLRDLISSGSKQQKQSSSLARAADSDLAAAAPPSGQTSIRLRSDSELRPASATGGINEVLHRSPSEAETAQLDQILRSLAGLESNREPAPAVTAEAAIQTLRRAASSQNPRASADDNGGHGAVRALDSLNEFLRSNGLGHLATP